VIDEGKYWEEGAFAMGEGIGADMGVDCELTEDTEASELELWKTDGVWEEDD
jgi:hypothetical protein